MTPTRDLVLSHLRQQKVQLWLPPYHQRDANGATNSDALRNLSQVLAEQLPSSSEAPLKVDDVFSILSQLQSHALHKLKRHSVDIKILATKQHFANLSDDDGDDDVVFASWGDTVATIRNGNSKKSVTVIRVENISSTLTVDKLSSELCCALNATTSRVIFKGKHISEGNLRKIVSSNDGKEDQKKNELLCIVSGHGYVPPAPAAAATASSTEESTTDKTRTDEEIIDSIRSSASRIAYNRSGFEITDQNGNLVPMSQADSISLLTALGLHRIGRSKMEKGREVEDDGDKRNFLASALVFLLEADAEWQGSSTLGVWKSKVDNYGLLQLDIAWNYLLLRSLENLSDASRRLEIAETVLRKQVHSNFVTLALVNAEANNPIPPLCTIFVRLFLLQGVANKMRNCNDTAAERLEWARVLCQQLRVSCPPDRVEILCGAYCVEPSTAISALRKFNGDPDAAGNFIASLREDETRTAKRRKRQHNLGRCANNSDFVNLDLLQTLSDLLGFQGASNNTDDRQDDQSTSNMICSGLLRLTNNNMELSLALYNEIGAQGVLQRAGQLDKDTGICRPTIRKEFEVSDVDVASLVSMGVEEERGRNALRATGSVEDALNLLLKDDDNTCDSPGKKVNGNHINNGQGKLSHPDESGEGSLSSSANETDDCGDVNMVKNANDFLMEELGHALSNDSKGMLEKEWLGVDLKEEWELIEEYS